MKKTFSILSILILLIFNSCNREVNSTNEIETIKSNTNARIPGEPVDPNELLIEELSQDQDFISLKNNLESFFSDIPNKDNFIANYNESNFNSGGENYFLNLTGYTNAQVLSKITSIRQNTTNLLNKYPTLKTQSSQTIQTIVESAYNQYVGNSGELAQKPDPCKECAKTWRPRMIWSTIMGGISGGLFGGGNPYGPWAGAVIGFASAGWGALDCLKTAGC